MGAYDNNHDEGHDIYLCIFTDRAKDDRYENKIITTLIMPVQDFSIQCRHCFEDKYKYKLKKSVQSTCIYRARTIYADDCFKRTIGC